MITITVGCGWWTPIKLDVGNTPGKFLEEKTFTFNPTATAPGNYIIEGISMDGKVFNCPYQYFLSSSGMSDHNASPPSGRLTVHS